MRHERFPSTARRPVPMLTVCQSLRAGIQTVGRLLRSVIYHCAAVHQWSLIRNGVRKINPAEIAPSGSDNILADIVAKNGLRPAGEVPNALTGRSVGITSVFQHGIPASHWEMRDVIRSGDQIIGEIVRVKRASQGELVQIAHILSAISSFLRFSESWQKKSRQNCYDRDNHQQFNKSKGPFLRLEAEDSVAGRVVMSFALPDSDCGFGFHSLSLGESEVFEFEGLFFDAEINN